MERKQERRERKGSGMKRVKVGSGGIDPDTALTQPIIDSVQILLTHQPSLTEWSSYAPNGVRIISLTHLRNCQLMRCIHTYLYLIIIFLIIRIPILCLSPRPVFFLFSKQCTPS
jgi:hypothetical protein